MKLTLDEIWKMADLLEEAQKIKVGGKKTLQEEPQLKTQQRVLRLPQLQISENWGKEGTVERDELTNVVESATRGLSDPFSKLRAIQNQMTSIASGEAIKNPRKILSQIILVETLNRLFKSFQASPAGFINEAFLSVIYGSTQKGAIEANAEGDIGDITDRGVPVSLKTLSYGEKGQGPEVKGSIANLLASINKRKKVYFDVYLKNASGVKDAVNSMEIYRFVVDATNVNQFLQLPPGTIAVNAQTGKLEMPQTAINEGFVRLSEEPELEEPSVPDIESELSLEATNVFKNIFFNKNGAPLKMNSVEAAQATFQVLKANKFNLPKSGQFREIVNNLDTNTLTGLIRQLKSQSADKAVAKKVSNLISQLAGDKIGKIKPSKKSLETEFHVPFGHWMTFVDKYQQEKIIIEFSDKRINELLQSAVKSLDASITEIFNNLSDFTTTLQSYLTSTSEDRNQKGNEALELAKKLKPSTEKVVKTDVGEKV